MDRMSAPAPAPGLPEDLRFYDRGWLSSSTTICLGAEPAVIDTGYVKHQAQTLELVQAAIGAQPLAQIAHTHLHSDHCGGTHALQTAWPRATTWVPEPTLSRVQAWDESRLSYRATGQRCPRFRADRALVPGRSIRLGARQWKIHAAPGHDKRAIFLFDAHDGILIAGDALWEQGVGVIFPEIEGTATFTHFLGTLDIIEALQPQWVLPGHGAPIAHGPTLTAALQQARERIAYFRAQPQRHAEYAAKVLVKYQLMDVERMERAALLAWMDATPDLHKAQQIAAPDKPWETWAPSIIELLLAKGALRAQGRTILDA